MVPLNNTIHYTKTMFINEITNLLCLSTVMLTAGLLFLFAWIVSILTKKHSNCWLLLSLFFSSIGLMTGAAGIHTTKQKPLQIPQPARTQILCRSNQKFIRHEKNRRNRIQPIFQMRSSQQEKRLNRADRNETTLEAELFAVPTQVIPMSLLLTSSILKSRLFLRTVTR